VAAPTQPTVREATRQLMRELGMTTVFGNPGSTELGFLADWPDDFRYVLALQETSVLSMADGFAQYSGNAAMVNLHSSGGVGHSIGALVTAYKNHTPMVVIAGQQARDLLTGEPFLGSSEAVNLPKPYVKWSVEPARAADVPAAIQRAYQMATQPPYGPTLVSVPADDWDAPAEPVRARPRVHGYPPDPAAVHEIVGALNASERPAIVVGGAVDADGAVDDVVALAERAGARVLASPMSGRCSFPEEHPLFAGFLRPARRSLDETLAAYDLVLVLGAPAFVQHVQSPPGPSLPPLYVISDDPVELAWSEGNGVRGTPRLSVRALLDGPDGSGGVKPGRDWPEPVPAAAPPARSEPMTAAYALRQIAGVVPEDVVVVEEIPSHRNEMHRHFPIRGGGGFLTMQSGALGFSVPAAVGVSLAQPKRPVLALVGDGSSMYAFQGLWTAVREQTPVTFVVLDNAQYAALSSLADAVGADKVPGLDLGGIDFVGLARSLGCAAEKVSSPEDLAPAVRRAMSAGEPMLLHVPVASGYERLY
jgi:benzoylformate decarboxylase